MTVTHEPYPWLGWGGGLQDKGIETETYGAKPEQRGKDTDNHILPYNYQTAKNRVAPTSHLKGDSGDTSRQKMLFIKCLWIIFQKMALAVMVINGLLSLQNIHQLSTQALQVMQKVNIDWKHEIWASSPSTN